MGKTSNIGSRCSSPSTNVCIQDTLPNVRTHTVGRTRHQSVRYSTSSLPVGHCKIRYGRSQIDGTEEVRKDNGESTGTEVMVGQPTVDLIRILVACRPSISGTRIVRTFGRGTLLSFIYLVGVKNGSRVKNGSHVKNDPHVKNGSQFLPPLYRQSPPANSLFTCSLTKKGSNERITVRFSHTVVQAHVCSLFSSPLSSSPHRLIASLIFSTKQNI